MLQTSLVESVIIINALEIVIGKLLYNWTKI